MPSDTGRPRLLSQNGYQSCRWSGVGSGFGSEKRQYPSECVSANVVTARMTFRSSRELWNHTSTQLTGGWRRFFSAHRSVVVILSQSCAVRLCVHSMK